jgi:general L-amino acid transport system permease protein
VSLLPATRSGRARLWQGALLVTLVVAAGGLWWTVRHNLAARQIRTGFAFLAEPAGFDIGEGPVPYTPQDSYLWAFLAGVANTLRVSAAGIVAATLLGTLVGLGRLSHNALVRAVSTIYVEVLRNVPLIVQLFFWYVVATELLPDAAEPLQLLPHLYLSKGGLQYPVPSLSHGWDYPELTPFNVSGGGGVTPEFLTLFIGLTTFTAAAVAEIVRSGVLAVSHGQTEAASALGLTRRQVVRHVVLPQARRIIVPPLTSQYLNLTKNSSLAVAIGYPDVVSIANTAINQNGQALECILLIMAVYLTVNLVTAAGMGLYERRVALVER